MTAPRIADAYATVIGNRVTWLTVCGVFARLAAETRAIHGLGSMPPALRAVNGASGPLLDRAVNRPTPTDSSSL